MVNCNPFYFQNVDKRIEYISAELKRQEDSIKDLDKKQDDLRENLTNMQTQMQKLVQAWGITEGFACGVGRTIQFSAKLLEILQNINILMLLCRYVQINSFEMTIFVQTIEPCLLHGYA